MKKLITIVLILVTATCFAWDDNHVHTVTLATTTSGTTTLWEDTTTLGVSSTLTSDAIDLNDYRPNGYFSLQYTFTSGAGTATFEYLLSNDGSTFTEPSTASDIGSGLAAGSDHLQFNPEPARYMKIKVTGSSDSSAINITAADLCIH